MTATATPDVLALSHGKFGAYERQMPWTTAEMRRRMEQLQARGIDGSPPPPDREILWDASRGVWDVNWRTEFGGRWGDENQKNEFKKKLVNQLGMSERQAEYAVLFLALAGYNLLDLVKAPGPNAGSQRIQGQGWESLEDIIDSYRFDDWSGKELKTSPLCAFFEHHFKKMRKSSMRLIFPQDWRDREYSELSFGTLEEFAMKLADGGTSSQQGRSLIGSDGVMRGKWLLEDVDGSPSAYSVFKILRKSNEEVAREKREAQQRGEEWDEGWGGAYVDEGNLAMCIRANVYSKYDIEGPDDNIEYMKLTFKTAQGGEWKLVDWLNEPGGWKSEDGVVTYDELWMRMLLETWAFDKVYNMGVDYARAMSNLDDLDEVYKKHMVLSQDTKHIFRVNLMQIIFSDAVKYFQARTGETLSVSNELGMAALTFFRVYHEGMADWETLVKILGEDSAFFQADTFLDIIAEKYTKGGPAKRVGLGGARSVIHELRDVLDPVTHDLMSAAFDEHTGRVKNQDAFMRLINIFNRTDVDQAWRWVVRDALKEAVQEQFQVYHHYENKRNPRTGRVERVGVGGEEIINNAEANGWYFSLFMGGNARMDINAGTKIPDSDVYIAGGGVRNDKAVLGYEAIDDMAKRGILEGTRINKPGDFKRGMHMVPPLEGITVRVTEDLGEGQGQKVYQKSLLKLLGDIQEIANRLRIVNEKLAHNPRYPWAPGETEDQLKIEQRRLDTRYKMNLFTDYPHYDIMREFYRKHWHPGKQHVDAVLEGKEAFEVDKFFSDSIYGLNFDFHEWTKGIGAVLDRHRSQLVRFTGIPLAEMTRAHFTDPVTGQTLWIDVPRAAKMFDYDILDHPAFRKKGGKRKLVKIATQPDGRVRYRWFYELDFNKIDKNRSLLARLSAGHEIAEAIRDHMESKRGDVRYTKNFYIDAINSLKGIGRGFFTDEDIAWIREKAFNGDFWFFGMKNFGKAGFYLKWWLGSAFYQREDKEGIWGEIFKIIATEIAKGVSF